MESFFNNYSVSDILLCGFFMGLVLGNLSDLVNSIIGYLHNKGWRVNDYERIIYLLNKENSLSFTNKDFETMYEAINNYTITLEREEKRKEKREKFLNKFRRNKKDV